MATEEAEARDSSVPHPSARLLLSSQIPDHMNSPTIMFLKGSRWEWPLPPSPEPLFFKHDIGLRYEAEHVRQCLLNGNNSMGAAGFFQERGGGAQRQQCARCNASLTALQCYQVSKEGKEAHFHIV